MRLRTGKYKHTAHFILQTAKRDLPSNKKANGARIGYTATTKTGNSVERSRIKRRLRHAVREVFPLKARADNDYVLIAKRPALTGDFETILKDLSQALDHVHSNRANVHKRKHTNPKTSKS